MQTIILCVEYDGTDYYGWQVQSDRKTIQGELNRAVRKVFGKEWQVIGAGRTDTGVHSSGQIAHFVCDERLKIPRSKVILALNQKLPNNIRIKRLWFTDLEFHSRFDADLREYRYKFSRHPSVFERRFTTFLPYKLDIPLLHKSAEVFLGKHSFFTFSKANSSNGDYVCDIKQCHWQQNDSDSYELTIIADRYVYGMVRALVGAMIDVARHKRTISEIETALNASDRNLQSSLAPAYGLNLHRIYYPPPFDIIA
jgi:tRNA pseudouridine38-40 synthase